jgi:MoaA/NifB/PqqE/SkfB family radical SAM enzyme
MPITNHSHKNLFIITTYRCNAKCGFCCFRYQKSKECPNNLITRNVGKILESNPETKFAVKITGGEPFLKPHLVSGIILECNKYKNVRNIGIGSNGLIDIPEMESAIPIHLYFSRHHYDDKTNGDIFKQKVLPIQTYYGPDISFRLNCNMIKGGIDSQIEILKYLLWAKMIGVSLVCFRELNKLDVDNDSMYPGYIYEYLKYYKKNIIKIDDILTALSMSFLYINTVSNGYDTNINYSWDGIRVRFRKVDEKELLVWNSKHTEIDEYVIHPDGLVTGCWDRAQKVLNI